MATNEREALAELVACKELEFRAANARWVAHQTHSDSDFAVVDELQSELAKRQPLAWEAAHRTLTASVARDGAAQHIDLTSDEVLSEPEMLLAIPKDHDWRPPAGPLEKDSNDSGTKPTQPGSCSDQPAQEGEHEARKDQARAEATAKVIAGALRDCIRTHGPITKEWIGSATKRIRCALATHPEPEAGAELKAGEGCLSLEDAAEGYWLDRNVRYGTLESLGRIDNFVEGAKFAQRWLAPPAPEKPGSKP